MGDLLNPLHFRLTEKALDMRQTRQKLISSNIANVNTPQYQSRDISFQEQLRRAAKNPRGSLYVTEASHLRSRDSLNTFRPIMTTPGQAAMNNDLNSVDMEHELMKMSENNIMYDALIMALRKGLQGIEYAIREGGK